MKKITAFTLLEITLVLILSAVVLALSLEIMRTFQQQYYLFRTKAAVTQEILTLDHLLETDIGQAQIIRYKRDSSRLILDLDSIHSVQYTFGVSSLIRVGAGRDSFALSARDIRVQAIDSGAASAQTINQFSFTIQVRRQALRFHFTKAYPAAYFLNYENKHLTN